MTYDEQNMVRGLQAKDAESFARLYAEYGTRISRFCRRLCGNDTDAEDLTQEVFLAAYQAGDQFEGRSSLATWLYRIAVYRWRAMRRKHRIDTLTLEERQTVSVPDSTLATAETLALEKALAALSQPQREAFLLVKSEGLLCREAAEALGIPEGTVKTRVYTAILRLQHLLTMEDTRYAHSIPSVRHTTEACDEL